MSFFFRKAAGSSAAPVTHQSEAERLRGRQLASLIRIGAQAVTHDQSMFDVTVRLPDNRIIFIRITLPDRFPVQPPVVQLTSPAQHPWLDSNMRVVGHNDLNNWSAHSDLGRIVSEIMSEFSRHPPAVGNNPPQGGQQRMLPAYSNSYQQQSPAQPGSGTMNSQTDRQRLSTGGDDKKPVSPERRHTQTPAIPAVFPELEELSTSQLERLFNDPSALKAYVNKMASVQNLRSLHQDLVQGNVDLARKNLKYEKSIEELQSRIEVQKVSFHEIQERLAVKQARQQAVLHGLEPHALVQKVSLAADQADSYSEDLASKFTNGQIEIQSFIQEYLQCRKLYHLRKTKVARFSSQ